MKLTDLSIRALPLQEIGQRDYPDHIVRGLVLRVGKRSKTFMLLSRSGTRRNRTAIGRYPDCSLSHARERARNMLAEQRVNGDRVESVPLGTALDTYYRIRARERRAITNAQCERVLEKYLRPPLGKRQLDSIKAGEIVAILDTLLDAPGVRRNAWAYIAAFFRWSYRRGYLDRLQVDRIEAPPPCKPRERVLTGKELAAIWRACPQTDYGSIVRLCMLTGQRIGQWMFFRSAYLQSDLVVWPGEAMKGGKTHMLPLTPMVKSILLPRGNQDAPFSWQMNSRDKERLDRHSGVSGYCHHDFRRTWATISAEELGTEPHIIESVLAHAVGTQVSRTYNRALYHEPMRKALLAFEELLQGYLSKPEGANGRRNIRDVCTT